MGVRMIRLVPQHLSVAGYCLVQSALRLPYQPEVVVHLKIIRLERQSALVRCVRIMQPTLRSPHITQIVVKSGYSGVFDDRFADENRGAVMAPGLMRENSEQMERVGMTGVGLQDLCVELLGFDETSALMAAHGSRE